MLGGLSRPEHARPLSDRARAGGVGVGGGALNADHLAFWGGWFPHWLPLFMANNWDLIWEEISKAPATSALRSDGLPS